MASLLAFAGSVLVYLASSQQRLLCRPLPGRAARWAGAALEGAALLLLLQCRSPATAVLLTNVVRARDLLQDLNMAVSVEDMWGGDIITAATSHIAATTRPASLLMTPFFNDWTDGHLAGYSPRSQDGFGSAPLGPGLGIEVDISRLGKPVMIIR